MCLESALMKGRCKSPDQAGDRVAHEDLRSHLAWNVVCVSMLWVGKAPTGGESRTPSLSDPETVDSAVRERFRQQLASASDTAIVPDAG
jgi:hypothetical protein